MKVLRVVRMIGRVEKVHRYSEIWESTRRGCAEGSIETTKYTGIMLKVNQLTSSFP